MKRYSFVAPAGVPVEFDHPGRFFSLLNCITPVDVSLQQGGAMPEVINAVPPGFWADFEDRPFTRVRVISPIEQRVSFLVSMVKTGWSVPDATSEVFSYDIGGLAASTPFYAPKIDLGEHWASTILNAQLMLCTASTGGNLVIYCGDDDLLSGIRHAVGSGWSGNAVSSLNSSSVHVSSVRPTGRYVEFRVSNGATPQPVGAKGYLHVLRNVTA